jgi:hypothetical protein
VVERRVHVRPEQCGGEKGPRARLEQYGEQESTREV